MNIPFTPSEENELNAFMTDFNRIGETQLTIETYLAELIRHNTIKPWRNRLLERSTERRIRIIAGLPPEADAELQALVEKYAGRTVISTEKKDK